MPEPVLTPLACFHCGQAVATGERARWLTRVDGEDRAMCCAGCQAIAQAIEAAGLSAYYRQRSAPAAGPQALPAALAAELALYDEPDVRAGVVREAAGAGPGGTAACEATLMVEGMRCGACVWLIERALARAPGVLSAQVNYATERATLRWDPAATGLATLLARVAAVGYRALPYDARQRATHDAQARRSLARRLFVAGLAMMQVMMYAWPAYTARVGEIEPGEEALMRWASLLLTVPVVLYSAQPFFAAAWRDLKARAPGMDVPVALGLAAAFAASAWATVVGHGEVYFDSVTMFVFLLLGARHLEWLARRRAGRAVDALAAALPERVERLPAPAAAAAFDPDWLQAPAQIVPAQRLAPGDLVRVGDGARFPVDVTLLAGRTVVDQSLLTGESAAVARGPGDAVPGGAINAGSPVLGQVLRSAADSTLSTIERLIERAAHERPPAARLADRIARDFVIALLVFAAVVAAIWWVIEPARALPIAIAVLVVSCPCALSLATPAALAAATGALTRHGVLVGSGRALEAVAGCTDVVFDKTGTLTRGQPTVVEVRTWGMSREAALAVAAAMESGSSHPLAAALRAAAPPGEPPVVRDLVAVPGRGVEGMVDGQPLRLGSSVWCGEWSACPRGEHDDIEVWLVGRDGARACLRLADALRDDAAATVGALTAAGLRAHLLTGDHPAPAARVADRLGIALLGAQMSPADKLARVRELQAQGRRVLMVGDGINDAPVLAAADASVAVGEATALARTAADAVLLAGGLRRVIDLVAMARDTRRVIVQNLGWATLYNLVAIPAAAFGLVPPWVAALGMSASSLLVVGNALRLRVRPWKRSTSSSR
jgi:Cu2+-exporting ATPase